MRPIAWFTMLGACLVLAVACSSGPRVQKFTDSGKNLFTAASSGDVRLVSILIENGANVNAKNAQGETPLDCAVNADSGGAVSALLDAGAKQSITDAQGRTPVQLAQQERHMSALRALRSGN